MSSESVSRDMATKSLCTQQVICTLHLVVKSCHIPKPCFGLAMVLCMCCSKFSLAASSFNFSMMSRSSNCHHICTGPLHAPTGKEAHRCASAWENQESGRCSGCVSWQDRHADWQCGKNLYASLYLIFADSVCIAVGIVGKVVTLQKKPTWL